MNSINVSPMGLKNLNNKVYGNKSQVVQYSPSFQGGSDKLIKSSANNISKKGFATVVASILGFFGIKAATKSKQTSKQKFHTETKLQAQIENLNEQISNTAEKRNIQSKILKELNTEIEKLKKDVNFESDYDKRLEMANNIANLEKEADKNVIEYKKLYKLETTLNKELKATKVKLLETQQLEPNASIDDCKNFYRKNDWSAFYDSKYCVENGIGYFCIANRKVAAPKDAPYIEPHVKKEESDYCVNRFGKNNIAIISAIDECTRDGRDRYVHVLLRSGKEVTFNQKEMTDLIQKQEYGNPLKDSKLYN